jgi:uncharacterized surface protein with fasciclin (FAS1) repeats
MRRTAIAVVSVAAALTLSACGGSTDEATSGESSSVIKGGALTSEEEVEIVEEEVAEGIEEIPDTSGLSSNRVCPGVYSDLVVCLESNGNFSYFLSYLNDAQRNELSTSGPLTVFAPTDEAFKALGDETLGLLDKDEKLRKEIIAHHIVEGAYQTPDFFNVDPNFIDVAGFTGVETDLNGVLFVEGAVVDPGDNLLDNGYIHVINKVLIPGNPWWEENNPGSEE